MTIGTSHFLREPAGTVRVGVLKGDEVKDHHAVGKLKRRFHGVSEALALRGFNLQAIHHYINVVFDLLFQFRRVAELMNLTVNSNPGVALRSQVRKQIHKLALAGTHYWCQHLELQPLLHVQDLIHNLLRSLTLNHRIALRAVRRTRTRIQKAQVIMHFRDRTHRGTRVTVRGLLINRHGRRQALNEVHVRLIHLPQKLASVRRQRLHISPLAFRKNSVKRKGRLTRAGKTGEHDHRVAGQVNIHALQVMLPRAAHHQTISHYRATLHTSAKHTTSNIATNPDFS